MEMSKEMVKGR
nr:hypothetical protein [Tanacetum cinerariifolium]